VTCSPRIIAQLVALALAIGVIGSSKPVAAQPSFNVVMDAGGKIASQGVTDDPANCLGPLTPIPGTITLHNGDVAQPVTAKVTLDPGLQFIPGSCTATVGTCTIVDATHLMWLGMLDAQENAVIRFTAQIGPNVPIHTQLCALFETQFGTTPPLDLTLCLTTNSANECGLAAPVLGRSGEVLLAALLVLTGAVLIRRRRRV
jgi:hypothetical protein